MNTAHASYARIAKWIAAGLVALMVTLMSVPATDGQSSYAVQFCRKLTSQASTSGREVATSQCGTKFTTSDPYIAIVVHLRDVRTELPVVQELLDPDQASAGTVQTVVRVEAGSRWANFWIWRILAVAADQPALAAENFTPGNMIPLTGKAVRERPGDWTLQLRLRGAPPVPFKFTLQAAP
jgi:hypothetical protein